jgi:hypothetical protein
MACGYTDDSPSLLPISHGGTEARIWHVAREDLADDWWVRQKGLRQTLRTEAAVGKRAPDAELDQWAITVRYETESPG